MADDVTQSADPQGDADLAALTSGPPLGALGSSSSASGVPSDDQGDADLKALTGGPPLGALAPKMTPSAIPGQPSGVNPAHHARWATAKPPPAPPQRPGAPSSDPQKAQAPAPKPAAFSMPWLADIGKTVASQAALGVGDIAAIPGNLTKFSNSVQLGEYGLIKKAQEALGFAPKGSSDAAIAKAKAKFQSQMSPSDKAGDTASIFGMQVPTSQGTEKAMRRTVPALGYAPQSNTAKIAGAAARAIPMVAIPGVGEEGLLAKGAEMAASGATSEAAGEAAQKYAPSLEGAARLTGAFAGPIATGSVVSAAKRLSGGNPQIADNLMTALKRDAANNQLGMKPAEIAQAQANGTRIGLWNVGGPATKDMVRKLGAGSPAAEAAIGNINQKIAEQQATAAGNVSSHISDTLGVNQGAFDLQQAIKDGNQGEINNLYKALETDPSAQSLASPGLDQLSQSKTIQKFGQQAEAVATDPGSRIIPPQQINPTLQQPGNIFYWDQIKRGMDGAIGRAKVAGDAEESGRLMGLKTKLLNELDTASPAYAAARGAASDSFGAQNAVEAGYNALAGKANNFSAGQAIAAFKKYNPDQQSLFAQGAGQYLKEQAEKGGPSAVVKLFDDPNKAALLHGALGDNASSILGRAQSEAIMQNAKAYTSSAAPGAGLQDKAINAGLMFEVPGAIGHALTGNAAPLANLAGTKIIESVVNGINGKVQQAKALDLLNSIGSEDPAVLAQLPAKLKAMPNAPGMVGQVLTRMKNVAIKNEIANPTSQDKTDPNAAPDPVTPPLPDVTAQPQSGPADANAVHDPKVIAQAIAGAEGTAHNPRSSAVGKYQFINNTFIDQFKKLEPERAAQMTDAQILALRNTDEAAGLYDRMGPQFTQQNMSALKQHGFDPNATNAYMAHFLGGPGASQVLAADPGTPIESILPSDVLRANPQLQGKTAKQVQDMIHSIMNKKIAALSPAQETKASAAGGRIERKAGGRAQDRHEFLVNRLMLMAKRAKTAENEKTKPLLRVPDAAVAKALSIAQQQI